MTIYARLDSVELGSVAMSLVIVESEAIGMNLQTQGKAARWAPFQNKEWITS